MYVCLCSCLLVQCGKLETEVTRLQCEHGDANRVDPEAHAELERAAKVERERAMELESRASQLQGQLEDAGKTRARLDATVKGLKVRGREREASDVVCVCVCVMRGRQSNPNILYPISYYR